MKRIFVYMHYLEIGGAERSLIGLLNALDPRIVQIDLFLNQHTGEFMQLIPDHVNLLPQLPEYSAIERPIKDIVKEWHIGIAFRRIIAKYRHNQYIKHVHHERSQIDESVFQFIFRQVNGGLRDLSYLGDYDLAISFMHPHNIVLTKVKAKHKICWIHTDYSTVHVNRQIESPVWSGYDVIAGISEEACKAFGDKFPEVREKIRIIENILSPKSIRLESTKSDVSNEMPDREGELKILSIGRFCAAKRFEAVPEICRRMLDRGLRFKWYIVGYGYDAEIKNNIERYNVADTLILLGKKDNPYPYIKACDIYAQPSIYEGKSVTVREAQILCKPVVITNYTTAKSQVNDGIDGKIIPIDVEGCANGIYEFAINKDLQMRIRHHLESHDYGNETEVEKIYDLLND